MIEKIKTGIKLFRYCYAIKMCVGFSVFFLVVGIMLDISAHRSSYYIGNTGFFLLVVALWPIQMICSLSVSNMVQTSKWKKAIQTTIPTVVNFVCMILMYAILVGIKLYLLEGADEAMVSCLKEELIVMALMAMLMMIYCGIAFKLFIVSTILFFVSYFLIATVGSLGCYMADIQLPFWNIVGIGFLLIVIGAVAQYGISLLVYKYPMAKRGQLKSLQKYM